MPLATVTEVAPQRTNLEQTLVDLSTALTAFDTTYYSGVTPAVPTPTELTRLIASVGRIQTLIAALATGHTHDAIADIYEAISELRDEIDNAQSIFVGHTAEWKRDIMCLAKKMEQQSDTYISKASGSWVRRKTRNGLNAVGLDEHRRDATKRFLGRHKGKIAGAAGAGAVLWGALHMEGCSPSQEPPKNDTSSEVDTKFRPRNKSDDKEGVKYDGNGKNFSVGGFLNASKDTFANGALPEAQAFQGVWNYIDKHKPDEKWGPGERFHFHTTPNKELKDATHFDVNAYTGDQGTKVIEITWQKEYGTENSKDVNGIKITKVNEHTWKFTLHTNGSIEKTDIFHDGKPSVSKKNITKSEFQDDLRDIQGF